MCVPSNSGCLHFVTRLSRRLLIDRYYTNIAADFIQKWHRRSKSGTKKLEEGPRAVVRSATVSADKLLKDDGFRSNRKFCLARRNFGARCSRLLRGSQTTGASLGRYQGQCADSRGLRKDISKRRIGR